MYGIIDSKLFNILLLITIIGEFLLPWILKHSYKGYNSKTMVMSVLGRVSTQILPRRENHSERKNIRSTLWICCGS